MDVNVKKSNEAISAYYAAERAKVLTAVQAGEAAMRFNSGKSRVSLIHNASLKPMVDVLEYGATKYSPNNWKKGLDQLELLESLKRHVDQLIDDVNSGKPGLDPENNLHHIGAVMCNAMFYSYHYVIDKSHQ